MLLILMNNELRQPLRVKEDLPFGVSRFGVFCFECDAPIGSNPGKINTNILYKHFKKYKHPIPSEMRIADIVELLNNGFQTELEKCTNLDAWLIQQSKPSPECTCGRTSFSHRSNLNRHIKAMRKKDPKRKDFV